MAYLAVLLALSGSATALPGRNDVTSDDIVNGHVRRSDLGNNAVGTTKIGNGQVGRSDFGAGAVDGSKVSDDTLGTADVANESLSAFDVTNLTGADVNESSLSEVAAARVAGRGRAQYTPAGLGSICNPTGTTYVVCATMTMSLPATGRLLILASGKGYIVNEDGVGTCSIFTSKTGGFSAVEAHVDDNGSFDEDGGEFDMSVVTPTIGPGDITIQVHCNETSGDIRYQHLFISAVEISPS